MIKLESEIQGHSIADLEPYVISLYLGGKSTVEIGKMFGFSSEGIRRFLKRKKVRMRSHTETATIHTINHQYFRHIESESKAFWLGFILHRGQIIKRSEDSWYIMILVPGDKLSFLKSFKQEVSCSKSIYKQKNRNRYVLSVSSTSWAKSLIRLGWKEFRSGNRDFLLSQIKPELHKALLKGEAASE